MDKKITEFTEFIITMDKEELILFKKKVDDLGNDYVARETMHKMTEDTKTYSPRDGNITKMLLLELIKLKEENNNLKFHNKLEGVLK